MNNHKNKKLILILGDIIVLYSSLYLTLVVRYFSIPGSETWFKHFWYFSIVYIAWIIIFYINDLYNLHLAVNNEKFTSKSFKSIFIAILISAVFFYLNSHIDIAPKRNLVIYLIIFTGLFLLWRRFFNWSLNSYLPKIRIAFIGYNSQVQELVRSLRQKPHLGYEISTIFSNHTGYYLDGIPVQSNIYKIKATIKKEKINTIITSSDLSQSKELRSILFSCLPLKINFQNFSNFYEQITGKVPIEAISESWFLENLSEGSKNTYDTIKRIYDVAIASFILISTAVFWPLIGLLLKIENKESVFFMQKRVGKDGRVFSILKFRTQKTINSEDPEPAKKNDRRTTKIGNFLRKSRIDEIPQVINILLGDMSFIGPRPERPEIIERLEKSVPFYKERLLVKPGLTGWDQVSGEYHSPSEEDTLKKLQYDLFYIKNRSLYLDTSIILKTISTVLSRAGI
ncbi:sugar transferase [Candidatus Parcubacteria bacterium]|nr:MAG: sugar transferase [Candidatus Parcubacteria bacterium]